MYLLFANFLATHCLSAAEAIPFEPTSDAGITQKAQWLITVGMEGSGHHGFCDSGYLAALFSKSARDVVVNNMQTTGEIKALAGKMRS